MRNKLIYLLRDLEKQTGNHHQYFDMDIELGCQYVIDEYTDFPTFRYIIFKLNENPPRTPLGLVSPYASNQITAELKRMEADHLIIIDKQNGIRHGAVSNGNGPDFENADFEVESIVLTTWGKSSTSYFLFKLVENPVNTLLSVMAILISIAAIVVSLNTDANANGISESVERYPTELHQGDKG